MSAKPSPAVRKVPSLESLFRDPLAVSRDREQFVSLSDLQSTFVYDPIKGTLCKTSAPANPIGRCGVVRLGNQNFRTARIAWALINGEWPYGYIKHRNGDPRDFSFANLYIAATPRSLIKKEIVSD